MNRRTFIAALGGAAAAWPLATRAQQSGSMRRVGIIMPGAEGSSSDTKNVLAFRDGMRSLGWVEDKNVRFDLRWQAAGRERAEAAVAELTAIRCDVIVVGTIQAFLALRRLPSDSPIVFVNLPDPVATGLVSTIARTNSNFTGFTAYEYSITGKWLEILKEIAPGVQRVGFVFGTATAPVGENFYRALESKASSFNLQSIPISFADLSGLEFEYRSVRVPTQRRSHTGSRGSSRVQPCSCYQTSCGAPPSRCLSVPQHPSRRRFGFLWDRFC